MSVLVPALLLGLFVAPQAGLAQTTDTTPPSRTSATVDGRTLTLTYDEALDESSVPFGSAFAVTVDGTFVGLARTDPVTISGSTVVLTLDRLARFGSTVTLSYTVPTSNKIQDTNGNAAAGFLQLSITAQDTTAPSFDGASVNGTALTLTYDERLDTGSVPAGTAFAVTVDGTAASLAAADPVSISGSTVVLNLAEAVVSAGQTVTVSYAVPTANPIRDLAQNAALALTNRAVTVEDATPPRLETVSVDGTVLTLTYDEKLDANSVPVAAVFNVTVDGTTADPSRVSITGSTVVLTLAAAVGYAQTVTLTYWIPGNNWIRDLADNSAAQFFNRAVTVLDTTAPTLLTATVDGTALTLTYNERLDTASVPAASAFTVTVDGVAANPSKVAVDGASVALTLAAEVSSGSTVTVSYAVPGTNPIRDLASNAAAAFAGGAVTIGDLTAPTLLTATADGTALTLTYDEPLDTASVPAASAFTVTVDGAAANPSRVAVNGASVVLTLAAAASPGSTVTVSYAVPGANPIRDPARNAAAAFAGRAVTVLDTTAPTLLTATVEGTALTLTYDEPLDTTSVPAASAFTVTVNGAAANPSRVAVNGASVVLTLVEAVGPGSTVTVSYAVPGVNPIRDPARNPAAAFAGRAVTVGDLVAPTLLTATVEGTALTLTYDEPLDTTSVPAASAFTVTVDGAAANPSRVAVNGASVVLTLAAAVGSGSTVTVSYAVPGVNPIRDLARNPAAAFAGWAVAVGDLVAPTLLTATVEGAALTLIYDEPLDTASVPAASAFTVTVAGVAANPSTVAVDGASVALTLAEAVRPGSTVTVSYAVPGVNPIRDPARNAAAAFADRAVAQETLSSNDATLSALSLTDGAGTALPLSPAFSSGVTAYRATLGGGATLARVTAMASHGAATLSGSLRKAGGAPRTVAMASGTAAALPDLTVGDNLLTITVTAEDGTERGYTLSVAVATAAADMAAMRREALKTVLAAAGRQTLAGALDNVGARLSDVSPEPGLTFAGQAFGGPAAGLSGPFCQKDEFARPRDCGPGSRGAPVSAPFGSSAFSLNLGTAEGNAMDDASPRWSLWGRGDLGSFAGRPDGMRYDGEARSFWLGADARAGQWVAGLALSRGESAVDYGFDGGGETGSGRLETDLTALYPYGRLTLADGTELRGFVGAGTGEARHRSGDPAAAEEKTDLSMWMASMGLRKALPSVSGVSLAGRGDLGWVRMETGGGSDSIGGLEADGWRMRAGVEASRPFALAGDSSLEPFVEASGRQDGGDGLTGTGIELAGGFRYSMSRLRVEAQGRWLAAHTEDGMSEWGASVTARWTPDSLGRGLSFALTPRWGAATGGAQALWGDELLRISGGASSEASVDAELGYGIAAGPDALLRPFAETGLASGSESRVLRLGARYEAYRALALEVSGERRERPSASAEQALWLDFSLRF